MSLSRLLLVHPEVTPEFDWMLYVIYEVKLTMCMDTYINVCLFCDCK